MLLKPDQSFVQKDLKGKKFIKILLHTSCGLSNVDGLEAYNVDDNPALLNTVDSILYEVAG